jgi:glutathione-independent formaldehyde dehydrogenase
VRAVVFKGAFDVAVENVADPGIEKPLDAVVRVTTANICGSDLHPYEGRAPLDAGMVLGHENVGVVEATGPGWSGSRWATGCRFRSTSPAAPAATAWRAGPRLPAGQPVRPAHRGLRVPDDGPVLGRAGGVPAVPWADFNLLKLPAGTEHESDFAMLSDIFPTGYHGTELAQVKPGTRWRSSAPARLG